MTKSRQTPLFLLLSLAIALLVAACSSGGSSTAPAAEVDVNALPDTVTAQQVAALQESNADVLVLDVRELSEYEAGHIPGVTLMPVGEVASRLNEIPEDKPVIVTCRSGNRSGQVANFLREQGYENIHNMQGGILAWEAAGLAVER
ncbi:MAG: rhodanese-like domain-containing protein [Anaerolineales bacterium]|nr:rhodanese-like domain-containing protein [Anaerolineales bacterium]MCB9128892.1 rhodanese-like domain-containing protein [Ardenticatenales bacterium]